MPSGTSRPRSLPTTTRHVHATSSVRRAGQRYKMDFPVRRAVPVALPLGLAEALGVVPVEVLADSFNYLALFDNAQVVRGLRPDIAAIARMDRSGVIVTAPGGGDYDFVSRYFAPAKGIPEDPVTGAAHCALAPFWAHRLGKTEFRAFQSSRRGGEVDCRLAGDRVELEGSCVFYMEGEVHMPDGIVSTAITASEVPARVKPTNYPEPFASRMQGRVKRPLGDLFGLINFGVNLTQLAPGRVSALRHRHVQRARPRPGRAEGPVRQPGHRRLGELGAVGPPRHGIARPVVGRAGVATRLQQRGRPRSPRSRGGRAGKAPRGRRRSKSPARLASDSGNGRSTLDRRLFQYLWSNYMRAK